MTKSEKRKKLWLEREKNNLCIYCGKNNPIENKKGCKNCLDKKVSATVKYSKNNKDRTAQYRLLVKHQVIEKYGGKCNCCGETQILFLTIDHINNDGVKERKNKKYNTYNFYLLLNKSEIRNDIQVLCFNCNLGKSINGGVCPHKHINRKLSEKFDKRHIPQFDKRLKIVWPKDEELISMCNDTSILQTSKNISISYWSIINRLKRRNLYHLVNKRR